jgi:ferredoxin
VFTVPKHGKVEIVDTAPPETLRASVESAVRFCPTQALRIVEDNETSEGDS